jgi:hypothetical protein
MQTHLMQSINGREPLDGQICTVTASHMRGYEFSLVSIPSVYSKLSEKDAHMQCVTTH